MAGRWAGLELALACDIRVASERAKLGSFELRRGMHPADGGIVRLVNIAGAGIALEVELTGEPIDAQGAWPPTWWHVWCRTPISWPPLKIWWHASCATTAAR